MPSCTLSLRVASIAALLFAGCGMRSDMTTTGFDDDDTATPTGGTSTTSSTAGAAGGASATAISSGGASARSSGGTSATSSGGASAVASGGASMTASRSSSSLPSGGASAIAGSRASGGTTASSKTGGTTASSRTGGAGMPSGGSSVFASSGGGGASASRSSSSTTTSCTGVICTALPKTCKKIVQDPTACCPVCTDTGCPECGDIKCAAGTHKETLPGDCCPTCVADPLDACKKGQKAYEEFRKQLLDKVSSIKCQNSQDCTLVLESNACTTVCNVPLPTSTVSSYQDNTSSSAKTNCANCPPQPAVMCERMVASCLNGKCVAANPS